MESENSSEQQFFRLSVIRNAVDSLETAADFIARDDDLRWKWIAIALHHALYSFCIAALHNSNPDEVISRGRNEDNKTWLKKGDSDQWSWYMTKAECLFKRELSPTHRILSIGQMSSGSLKQAQTAEEGRVLPLRSCQYVLQLI